MKYLIITCTLVFVLLTLTNAQDVVIPDFQVNVDNGSGPQDYSSVAMDDSGNFVVVWQEIRNGQTNDIFAQRFSKGGLALGSEIKVNEDGFYTDEVNPDVAMNCIGQFVVTWNEGQRLSGDIHAQKFSEKGEKIGSSFKVNISKGAFPKVEMDKSGIFVICWIDTEKSEDILARSYMFTDEKAGDIFQINNGNEYLGYEYDISVNDSGAFIAVWYDFNEKNIYAQMFNRQAKSGSRIQINDIAVEAWPDARISINNNGNFAVMWIRGEDTYDIYAKCFKKPGEPFDESFKVNSSDSENKKKTSAIDLGNDGNLVVIWESLDGLGTNIYAQLYDPQQTKIRDNFRINRISRKVNRAAAKMNNNGYFAVTWTQVHRWDYTEIYSQIYYPDGISINGSIRVNQKPQTNFQTKPVMAVFQNNDFIIAWLDDSLGYDYDVFAQRFDSDGQKRGEVIKVNERPANKYNLDLAIDHDGDFILAWSENDQDNDIYARVYSSNGDPKDKAFMVNDDYEGYQQNNPHVEYFPDGRSVITWTDDRKGHEEIYGQIFDGEMKPLNANFRISYSDTSNGFNKDGPKSTECGQSYFPGAWNQSISVNKNGDFVVAWEDFRNALWIPCYEIINTDIYVQVFSSAGRPEGDNIQITKDGSSQINPAVAMLDSSFIICWSDQSTGSVTMQKFGLDGSALSEPKKVVDDDIQRLYYEYILPSITADNEGNFIITWNDGEYSHNNIYGQSFSLNGNPIGKNFLVTSSKLGHQSYVSSVFNENRLYNTWMDNRTTISGFDIWANVLEFDDFVSVEDEDLNTINSFYLSQNYPNPFNNETTINYQLPIKDKVTLKIYDLSGREVKTLINQEQTAGEHRVTFNAGLMSSGLYIYRITTSSGLSESHKMILIK